VFSLYILKYFSEVFNQIMCKKIDTNKLGLVLNKTVRLNEHSHDHMQPKSMDSHIIYTTGIQYIIHYCLHGFDPCIYYEIETCLLGQIHIDIRKHR
jgi:hypothetical protein